MQHAYRVFEFSIWVLLFLIVAFFMTKMLVIGLLELLPLFTL